MNRAQIDQLTAEAAEYIGMVPKHLRSACIAWVHEGRVPGDFLQAVIRNDLVDAVSRADRESLAGIVGLMQWFYNHAPGQCWGSRERLDTWAQAAAERRGSAE